MHACRNRLPNDRWHFQHGPIDLVIGAEGDTGVVADAHECAWTRFTHVLQELVDELPALRTPLDSSCRVHGAIARRMWAACAPYRSGFITSMAAVAGAVAQEILNGYARDGIERAWVNNGGDIALHLAPGQALSVGVVSDVARLAAGRLHQGVILDGKFHVASTMPVRGVATSGWRGRSQSLGIADSVTVLAHTAAQADAAATVVANAVNVQDDGIVRLPAWQVRDDSDLGGLLVTVDVPQLSGALVQTALMSGLQKAQELKSAGLLWFALLTCQGQYVVTTDPAVPLCASRHERSRAEALVGTVFA